MASSSIKNHYQTLGVAPTATQDEIKAQYRALVLKFHPDVNETEEAKATFILLQEAFETLGEEKSRIVYDEELRIANAPIFRGEPWPTKKYKYAKPEQTNQQQQRNNNTTSNPRQNLAEWEQAHYGIPVTNNNQLFWPRGEKEENMSDHQLYFRYRAQRLKRGGGHIWSFTPNKKFSTIPSLFMYIVRRNA